MLTLIPSSAPFMRIRASGWLGAGDYRRFDAEFEDVLKGRTLPFPILLDMRGFRGWTPAGLVSDLRWDLRNRRTFSKIAVVGDKSWHRWINVLGAPLFRAPLKFFWPDEEARAEAWLGV